MLYYSDDIKFSFISKTHTLIIYPLFKYILAFQFVILV